MTAYKESYGEHYIHEVVPFAEVVLVRIPKPTHRVLQGGKLWHKGDAVFSKASGLEGARRLTNTSSSHLEVACSRERFEDWIRLVAMMRDFSTR